MAIAKARRDSEARYKVSHDSGPAAIKVSTAQKAANRHKYRANNVAMTDPTINWPLS